MFVFIYLFSFYINFLHFPDKRLKFATTNVIVIMAIIWVTYNFNYGITGIIEDTYVANGTSQIHSTSTIFMVVYAFLNFYTYLIVYVYSPAQKSIYGKNV